MIYKLRKLLWRILGVDYEHILKCVDVSWLRNDKYTEWGEHSYANNSILNYLLSKKNENPSRGTMQTLNLIFIFCRKHLKRLPRIILVQHRTHLLAKSAINTYSSIYHRIKETFLIIMHLYALLGTTLHTSITAATFTFIRYLQHVIFFSIEYALSPKNARSLLVSPNSTQHVHVQTTEIVPFTKKRIMPSSM